MPGLHLHLLIPGLLGPLPRAAQDAGFRWPVVPALERLLSRSDSAAGFGDLSVALFRLFGYPAEADSELPTAAFSRLGEGLPADDAVWMHADPIHLQADRDRVLLFDARHLQLSREQAERLAQEVEDYYRDDGWQLEFSHPERWYLRIPKSTSVRTHPLEAVIGRHIENYLPAGDDGSDWRYRLNETQMLLHAAAVNQEREAAGLRPINGLWYSGSGALPPPPVAPAFSLVCADDPLARGLARHAGLESHSQPDSLGQLLSTAPEGDALVVLDPLRDPLLDSDAEGWCEGMERLETNWFQPLMEALKGGRVERLELYPAKGRNFFCTRANLRRFWRSSRSLRTLIGGG